MRDDLQRWMQEEGLGLDGSIRGLRTQQEEAILWALDRPEPYLLANLPTGSGKTLLGGLFAASRGTQWTYAVHTIRLQEQVGRTFPNLPILTGRRNHPCWVADKLYPVQDREYTAADGVCALGEKSCLHGPHEDQEGYSSEDHEGPCPYYSQLGRALEAKYRVTNYAMLLSLPPLRQKSTTLVADEGHNVEDAVVGSVSIRLSRRTFCRFGIEIPSHVELGRWREWALGQHKPPLIHGAAPDFGAKAVREALDFCSKLSPEDQGKWLVETDHDGVTFAPIWGRDFVMPRLFGHERDSWQDLSEHEGVQKVLLMSATLMGPEYIASTLGLPDGSWAYLDLPSTFPVANRPINYSPVAKMNYETMQTVEGRKPMQDAIDHLIEWYLANGSYSGIIHAVSGKYRDNILTESRFRGIMRTNPDEHAMAVGRGEASVLVAANLVEGWDGVDGLCRFVLFPKIPFPSLGDKRTKIRMEEDPRSYAHKALVAVVQGVGRGVRHKEDYADSWILDSSWQQLYSRYKEWLPESFTSAYQHKVQLV